MQFSTLTHYWGVYSHRASGAALFKQNGQKEAITNGFIYTYIQKHIWTIKKRNKIKVFGLYQVDHWHMPLLNEQGFDLNILSFWPSTKSRTLTLTQSDIIIRHLHRERICSVCNSSSLGFTSLGHFFPLIVSGLGQRKHTYRLHPSWSHRLLKRARGTA